MPPRHHGAGGHHIASHYNIEAGRVYKGLSPKKTDTRLACEGERVEHKICVSWFYRDRQWQQRYSDARYIRCVVMNTDQGGEKEMALGNKREKRI